VTKAIIAPLRTLGAGHVSAQTGSVDDPRRPRAALSPWSRSTSSLARHSSVRVSSFGERRAQESQLHAGGDFASLAHLPPDLAGSSRPDWP
jgi:hypothetical protein